VFMNVAVWQYCAFDNRIFEVIVIQFIVSCLITKLLGMNREGHYT